MNPKIITYNIYCIQLSNSLSVSNALQPMYCKTLTSDWLMVLAPMKDEWKCSLVESGELCVMTSLLFKMLMLFADL